MTNTANIPQEELDMYTLLSKGRGIILELIQLDGITDPPKKADALMQVEIAMTNLYKTEGLEAVYRHLTALAMRVAHKKGLGDPDYTLQ